MSKTPITILQELCAKRNFRDLPIFEDFTPIEPSEYRFHVKCTALGKEVIGYGLTKKIAKHMSAQMILQKYSYNSEEMDDDELNIPQVVDRNSITDLLDICAQRNFAKPEFKEISVVGPPHAPRFTIECTLSSIIRSAVAPSKKLAKQMAALEVLKVVKTTFPDSEKKLAEVKCNDSDPESIRKKIKTYLDCKKQNKIPKMMGVPLKDRHNFFLNQEEEFVDSLLIVLTNKELSDLEKYENLMTAIEKEWEWNITEVPDTDMKCFTLQIEFETFSCVLLGSDPLWVQVLNYFMEMLNVTDEPPSMEEDKYLDPPSPINFELIR
ncbi:unnamed protein product [Diamesa hyperborea]